MVGRFLRRMFSLDAFGTEFTLFIAKMLACFLAVLLVGFVAGSAWVYDTFKDIDTPISPDDLSQILTQIRTVAVVACAVAILFTLAMFWLTTRKVRRMVQPIEQINENLQTQFHASEEKYRLIAENMTDMIRVLCARAVVQYASPSHEFVLGYPPERIEGRVMMGEFMLEEERLLILHRFEESLEKKAPFTLEFRLRHRDGYYLTMETHYTPVFDERGAVSSVIAVCRDITERKRTEELLRKSDKLTVVGELAAGIGHEIRNPLTAIRGFVQLLRTQQENAWYTEVILSEVDRINQIVGEFMLLAKPQQQSYSRQDPRQVVEMVLTLLNSQALLYNVRFVAEFADVPPIHCEINQLKQVFINLIKNAIEAMPDGGDLKIQMYAEGQERVVIRFIDQGQGIPENQIHKLGEPFYTTKEKGTGLGLMMCFKILEAHHGTMQIDSELGRGTTIELSFPVYADVEQAARNDADPKQTDLHKTAHFP